MSWLDRLRSGSNDAQARLNAIAFEAQGWTPHSSKGARRLWYDAAGNELGLRLAAPDEMSAVNLDLDALRTHYRHEAASAQGGIVAVDIIGVCGTGAVRAILKYRPKGTRALVYDGVLLVPLVDGVCVFEVRALEHGHTGVRDAIVSGTLFQRGDLQLPKSSGKPGPVAVPGYTFDPYDPAYAGPSLCALPDDERLDVLLPQDPVSVVRTCLTQIAATLRIAPPLAPRLCAGAHPAAAPPLHPLTAGCVAEIFFMANQFAAAEAILEPDLARRQSDSTADGEKLAHDLTLFGSTCEAQSKFAAAGTALIAARDVLQRTVGEQHPAYARALMNLGRARHALGEAEDAKRLLLSAVAIFEAAKAPPLNMALTMYLLGKARTDLKEYDEALANFERALAFYAPPQGKPDHRTMVLNGMADTYHAMGDVDRERQTRARIGK